MASSISTLPPEILSRICDMVNSKQTTARFMQCSHQFYGVGGRHLFRDIDLLSNSTHAALFVEHLAALFLRKPDLGEIVRHLGIRIIADDASSSLQSLASSPELKDALKRWHEIMPIKRHDQDEDANSIIATHGHSRYEELDTGSEWSTTDTDTDVEEPQNGTTGTLSPADRFFVLVTLLTRLPKLEKLDLELPTSTVKMRDYLDSALRHCGNDSRFPLPQTVRSLCFGSSSVERRGLSCHGIFLPGLTYLYLHRITHGLWGRVSPEPNSLDITHLEFRDCRISPFELRRIVGAAKVLKTFIYELGEPRDLVEDAQVTAYQSIRRALALQKDNLQQIWIEYPHDYHFDDWGGAGHWTRPMESFSGFTKLRRLRIATTYVFGWVADTDPGRLVRALPEQIEELHLTHADEDEETVEGVRMLLKAKQGGRFPKLVKLRLETSRPWVLRLNAVMSSLISLATGLDLELRVFDNHSNTRIWDTYQWVAAARNGFQGRKEAGWGFDREVVWPERISGCMKRPEYEELESTETYRLAQEHARG